MSDAPIPEDIRLAAKHGAYWLDTAYPTWFEAIDTSTLDLAWPRACILGQLFHEAQWGSSGYLFFEGSIALYTDFQPSSWLTEHGFRVTDEIADAEDLGKGAYDALTEAWLELIDERR